MTWDNIISRSVWVLIQPGNFLFLILLLGLFLSKYQQKLQSNKNLGNYLVIISVTIMSFIGFTNFSSWVLWPLESRMDIFRNQTELGPYSGIIVLGGAESFTISKTLNQNTFNSSSERLIQTAALALKYPNLPIIYSGGYPPDPKEFKEHVVAKVFFKNAGIDLSKIRFDKNSYNTHSNAIESRALIKESERENWLLVTSAFHMPRSVGTFQRAGINVQPYPVDYRTNLKYDGFFKLQFSENFKRFDMAIHEYIGLFAYFITDRSNKIFPSK